MTAKESFVLLISGLAFLAIATVGEIMDFWRISVVSATVATILLVSWSIRMLYILSIDYADLIESKIGQSTIWHGIIIIGGCFSSGWIMHFAVDDVRSIINNGPDFAKVVLLVAAFCAIFLFIGIVVQMVNTIFRFNKTDGGNIF